MCGRREAIFSLLLSILRFVYNLRATNGLTKKEYTKKLPNDFTLFAARRKAFPEKQASQYTTDVVEFYEGLLRSYIYSCGRMSGETMVSRLFVFGEKKNIFRFFFFFFEFSGLTR